MSFAAFCNLQAMIFTFISIGFLLRKIGIVSPDGKKLLSSLVIDLFLPCATVLAFVNGVTSQALADGVSVLLASFIIHVMTFLLGLVLFRKLPPEQRTVLRFETMFSNSTIQGGPMVEGLTGSLGYMYVSFYAIPLRVFMWTIGLGIFLGSMDVKKAIKNIFTHPCIVGLMLGILLMLTKIKLPVFLENALTKLGACTTPVSMILIGSSLADVNIRRIPIKTIAFFSALRLLIIPAMVWGVCILLRFNSTVTLLSVLMSGTSAAMMGVAISTQNGCGEELATSCVVTTTVLSLLTLPFWYYLLISV